MAPILHTITFNDEVKLNYPGGTKPHGTDFTIHYHTVNGNNPQSNNDYIGLWRSSGNGKIPKDAPALASYPVGLSTPDSSKTLLDLPIDQNEYVLGYSLGADPTISRASVCATLSIPAGGFDPEKAIAQSVNLDLKGNEASIWLEYSAISGANPKSSNNWVAIWKGDDLSAIGRDVPVFSQVTQSVDASGKMAFDGVLRRGSTYLLGYFLNGYNAVTGVMKYNNLAAYIVFDTDE